MKTKCVPGDLAFITHDEPGCEANIGRIVSVYGPLKVTSDRGPEWLIVPVNPSPFCYLAGDEVIQDIISTNWKLRHSDAWLAPIRPGLSDDESNDQEAIENTADRRTKAKQPIKEKATDVSACV